MKNSKADRGTALSRFLARLTAAERKILKGLRTPFQVQTFLDSLAYSADDFYRCPLRALRDRTAACFDGGLFAAVALRLLGHRPLVLDMIPNDRDDDHILALYRVRGFWGAVAKSNFSGLRFREPVHRTVRELVLSYFEQYFNVVGEKTLRGYTAPVDLSRLDRLDWMEKDDNLEALADRLDTVRRFSLLTPAMVKGLSPVDPRTLQAGLTGSNDAGLWKP